MSLITHYFPNLTPVQKKQFAQLETEFRAWNERITLYSGWLGCSPATCCVTRLRLVAPYVFGATLGTLPGFISANAVLLPESSRSGSGLNRRLANGERAADRRSPVLRAVCTISSRLRDRGSGWRLCCLAPAPLIRRLEGCSFFQQIIESQHVTHHALFP